MLAVFAYVRVTKVVYITLIVPGHSFGDLQQCIILYEDTDVNSV